MTELLGAPHGSAVAPLPYAALKAENSRLLREDLAARRLVYRGMPEVVTLNHTDLCNLKCIMCPRSIAQGTHRLERRVLEHVAEALFPTARKLTLTTSGGEPLAADFDFLLERALRYGVRIDAVTNGTLLTRELYARARAALDHLNVSVDCHVPEVYEHIRAGSAWENLERRLLAVRDERREHPDDVLYSMSAVVMRSNLPHLPEMVRFAKDMGAEGLVFQRLKHEIMAMPHEAVETDPGPAATLAVFEQACAVAREVGMNLFLTEFGLPGVLARPPRPKHPPTIEDQGLCWFLAQQLGVMYTGECYPCCIPTDHCLGNVLYEDPAAIWNGAPMQALRAAHLSGRGTTFCTGCLHAPHLPAPDKRPLLGVRRTARLALNHVGNNARRWWAARTRRPVYDGSHRAVKACDGVFHPRDEPFERRAVALPNELAERDRDGSVWTLWRGELRHSRHPGVPARVVLGPEELGWREGARAACLRSTSDGALLLGFEAGGRLWRVDTRVAGRPTVELALEFPDERGFARQPGVSIGPDQTVWVGEYGLYPGARCARVWRSVDQGRSFAMVRHLREAKHVHAVLARRDGGVLVTTGDLADERRLYVGSADGRRWRRLGQGWWGFTAIAESDHWVHFGSDLPQGNGLMRLPRDLRGEPEWRPFTAALDLQVRQLVAPGPGGGRLLALLGMDEDLAESRDGKRPTWLVSEDEGRTWFVLHRFEQGWHGAAEAVLLLDEARGELLAACTTDAFVATPWLSNPDAGD